jgi:hypothetical protein
MITGGPLKAVDPDASAAARLGADLRALRVERELTLIQLGDKIGFSAQYISGAELARATVSARFVAAGVVVVHGQNSRFDPQRVAGIARLRVGVLCVGASSVVPFGEALGGWLSVERSVRAVEVVVGQPCL